jgi:hypothetical protein
VSDLRFADRTPVVLSLSEALSDAVMAGGVYARLPRQMGAGLQQVPTG